MSDENELLEPLATEAGQQAIARAINNLSSLEYAVRAERAATTATQKADEALNSADDASDSATEARNWATKTDGYVAQETITIPSEQEGDDPTTETIDLYSARYYAALAQDIYNNLQFDTEPTENSTNLLSSGAIYDALDLKADKSTTYTKTEVDTQISTAVSNLVNSAPSTLDTLEELANALGDDPNFATTIATQLGNKADKSDTYTKTEVDTALGNVQSTLTFDNVPTANSNNPVKSSGIKTALDGKQDTLTFDSTPTANSNNPVTSGGIYTALQNVNANIEVDDEITEDSDNPVTSAAIYEALQNFTPSGGGGAGNASGTIREELWGDINGWNSQTITLNKSWKDYDVLEFVGAIPSESPTSNNPYITENYLIVAQVKTQPIKYLLQNYDDRYMTISFTNDTTLTAGNNNDFKIYNIYGIKFSKNLSEQMYSNVLYENSSGTQGNITLSDSYENYDFLEIECGISGWNLFAPSIFKSVAEIKKDTDILVTVWGQDSFIRYTVTSPTQLTYHSQSHNILVYKIVGHKLAKGGYSGIVSDARMTVKSGTINFGSVSNNATVSKAITFDSPMPDTNYQVLVNLNSGNGIAYPRPRVEQSDKTVNGFTLKVFGAGGSSSDLVYDWIAIRPNSYTREGMVEDVLFSSASGVNSGTINLSGNISDYDLIQFETNLKGFNNALNESSSTVLVSQLITLTDTTNMGKCLIVNSYDNTHIKVAYINDNTLSVVYDDRVYITKIIGIKFGRYVSGVAVDTTVTQNSNAVVTSGAVYEALQNYTPSGGGSSITVDSTITQGGTNPVEGGAIYTALGDKADKSTTYTKTEVDTAISSKGDVTTNTDQNITGTKTFVGSKKVAFKQSTSNDKLGFTLYGNTGTERGYLEFNPTNTVDGVAGLMTLGNYATSAASLTQVGFRRYSNISGASGAYNLLMPMVADARTPFSLTTTYQNFYLPLGFTDGTTTVKTAKSGVVDLSPLLASLESRIAALEGN